MPAKVKSHSTVNALEPGPHAGEPVGVAVEVVAGVVVCVVGRQHGELDAVLAGSHQLDVVAVVRTVAGHHGQKLALDAVAALLSQTSYFTSR